MGVQIGWYEGERADLRWSFELAEDSAARLDSYLHLGRVLVAREGDQVIGHLQLVPRAAGEVELTSMAVVAERRATGVGRALVEAALAAAADSGADRMLVATAAASAGDLRFYQRCGFRLLSVERDAFTPETGYPEPILIEGILLRDRVWLDQPLARPH